MGSAEIRSLLQEATVAADPGQCGLSDYRDLQELLGKIAGAAERLLEERDQMNHRLRRSSQHEEMAFYEGGEEARRPESK